MRLQHILPWLLLPALAACGNRAPAPATPADTGMATGEASARLGEASIHVSVVQTSALDAGVARGYGIERDPGTILLLVAVRDAAGAAAAAAPLKISATASDLRGGQQPVAMRAVQVEGLTDYIGTTFTTLPDTLRFDVHVARGDGASADLQLSRDFYPQ